MKELIAAEDFEGARKYLEEQHECIVRWTNTYISLRFKDDLDDPDWPHTIRFDSIRSFLDFVRGFRHGHRHGVAKKVEELADPKCEI